MVWSFLAGALGLDFQVSGIYGIFETFIRTKYPLCFKYSNISNWIFYPYPVKGSGKGKNKGNFSKSAKHPSRGEPFGCFALGVYI